MSELQEYDGSPLSAIREEVIEQLKLNYAHSNLDVEEFERRLDEANTASTRNALIHLVQDLPVIRDNAPAHTKGSRVAMNPGPVRESATMVAILSGTSRKGLWRPARSTNILTFMGGLDLDYSQAEMPPGVTEINVFCLMGGLDIIVPPGLNVEVAGLPILGGIDDKTRGTFDPSAPTLRIKGLVVMGGIDVKEAKKRDRGRR